MLTRRRNSRLSVLDVISSALFHYSNHSTDARSLYIYIYIHVSSFLLIVCETRGKLIHRKNSDTSQECNEISIVAKIPFVSSLKSRSI